MDTTDDWKVSTEPQLASNWLYLQYNTTTWLSYNISISSFPSQYPTIYMRNLFQGMNNSPAYELHITYACGIVVYLNGEEIYRDHLPYSSPISPFTLATYCQSRSISVIRNGIHLNSTTMVLAVEHHAVSNQTWELEGFSAWLTPLSAPLRTNHLDGDDEDGKLWMDGIFYQSIINRYLFQMLRSDRYHINLFLSEYYIYHHGFQLCHFSCGR